MHRTELKILKYLQQLKILAMNIVNEIEDQFNPIIIALNIKIDTLISTLNKEQLEKYQNAIKEKKEEIKSKLSESLTGDQLVSILNQLK
ncbi:hypothetical protein [Lutibacter sp.]|uniref:hypothetical protein n=1 Tax=Lutibacter sp. TaxID=1925666 RepID=UPI0035674986